MDKKISSAFDTIKAEQELKTATKYFLCEKYNSAAPVKAAFPKKVTAVIAICLSVIICASAFIYSTPVSAVSIDGDTTCVELGVNCFDKVVKVTCFGNEEAVNCQELKNKDYRTAVSAMLENAENNTDEAPVLTVSCKNAERGNRMTEEIRGCHANSTDVQHHNGNHTFSDEAHSHGISTGKYSVYLTLKQYEPDLTAEEAAKLTMNELREKIALYEETSAGSAAATTPSTTQHYGNGNGKHHGTEHH